MKRLLLLAPALVATACIGGGKAKTASDPWTPRFGRMTALYEARDGDTRTRVGFMARTAYDDGRIIYWVSGSDRSERLGFILSTGRAYRYVWHAGRRAPEPEDLGADVRENGARRILGRERPVYFEETSLDSLRRGMEPAPQKTAPKDEAADDEGCGCGDE